MKLVTLLAILYFIASDAKAQLALTLEQCIEYAFNNNNDVRTQENELSRNKLNLKQANYSLLPSINVSYSHKYNAGRSLNYETYSWENREIQQGNLNIIAELNVFRGLYGMYNRNIIKSQIDISRINIEKSRLFVGIEIIKSFYGIKLLNTNIFITNNILLKTQREISKLQEKVNVGILSKASMYEMMAQEKKEVVSKINLENQLAREYNNLKSILNWREESTLSIFEVNSLESDSFQLSNNNVDSIINDVLSLFILHEEKELSLRQADFMIKKQKSNYFPKVNINSYLSSRYLLGAVNPTTRKKGYSLENQLSDNRNNQIDLAITMPLFNKFDNKVNIKLMGVEKSQMLLRYDSEIQSLETNLLNIKNDILNLKKRISETTSMVNAYKMSYDANLEQYNLGQLDSYAISATKNNYLNTQLELSKNKIEYSMNLEILKFYEKFIF